MSRWVSLLSNPRIIAGKARGHRLRSVPGNTTRPITDRVKEALFSILGADIQDATFLDLFAGTGSVGIEALSRGAAFVRFVDNNHHAITTIKLNLKHTHLEEHAEVLLTDAFVLLRHPPDRQFDYIYVAPPQYKGLWELTMMALDAIPDWLSPDGWIIIQIDPVEYQAKTYTNFQEFDQRRYGSTLLVFLERR